MKLSLKIYPKLNHKQINILNDLSWHSAKLFNTANYGCIKHSFKNYYWLDKHHKHNWHKDFLNSHNYQQCFKVLEQDWKSFFAAIKDYKANPSKYNGAPRTPGFKKDLNEVIFTKFGIRKDAKFLKLTLSKKMKDKYKVNSLNLKLNKKVLELYDNISQIKTFFDRTVKKWAIIIIYKTDALELNNDYNNVMAIDLGLVNIAAITFKDSSDSFLIKGNGLTSKICHYQKKIDRLQSIRMKQLGDPEYFKDTKQIKALRRKSNNFSNDFLHKVSTKIIDYALKYKCNEIIIGHPKKIKQKSRGRGLKNFVRAPILSLIPLLEYKSSMYGIKLKKINESYTSKCDAFINKPVNKENATKNRVMRGLFKSQLGYINADINGSINIMKKAYKTINPELIIQSRAKGYVNNPVCLVI